MKLPPAQVAVLNAASATDDHPLDRIANEADLDPAVARRAALELAEDGLIELTETESEHLSLTAEGARYLEAGLPEIRLYRTAREAGAGEEPVPLGTILEEAGLDGAVVDIALANFARKEYGTVEDGAVTVDSAVDVDTDPEAAALRAVDMDETDIDPDVRERLEDRGLLTVDTETTRTVRLTDEGVTAQMAGVEVAETVQRVTPDLLTSGEWRDVDFAEYNVAAEAEELQAGREHVLRRTANRVKDVLVGMGFREMEGPHVDAQFWINDCLFMPQDHPARTHWDQFDLEEPDQIQSLPEDLVERVRSAHREGVGKDGDGYHSPWTEDVARSLDLRGHTTSLSMRYLSGEAIGDLEPPERFFSVEKVYRNDTLDPTHLLEFFQIEGWVLAESLSARDLMGTFTEFYERFGITDIEFKPHYNPYTEPSFELFGQHPETGELVEVGNSGLFRDEVLRPLGVEADVMAWGLSLERLLMLMYGFEDIRDVHGTLCDLDLLRDVEVVY
ncbi:MAG: phenylalanine--tRNA ligase subunit alpha [Salinirussus sp.]